MTKTNPNPIVTAATWLDHVAKHEYIVTLNQIHKSILDLFKITKDDEVPQN